MASRGSLSEPLLPGDDQDDADDAAERGGHPPAEAGAADASDDGLGPLGSRSWLSSLAFAWVAPLLQRGSSQAQLQQSDLFSLPHHLLPAECGRHLWSRWQRERARAAARGAAPSLLRALAAAYGKPYLALGLLKAAGDALNFAGPLLLNLLLRHLAAPPGQPGELRVLRWRLDAAAPAFGYACAGALAASLVAKALLGAHYGYRQALIAARLRSAVTAAVFRKVLAVNTAALAAAGSGRVQTLMSVDADRLVNLCLSFHELWSLPAQIGIALWLLYTQVQFAFLAGLALVLLLIPVNRLLATRIQAASVRMMAAKDRRVGTMLEVLRGIRPIKCAGWEAAFAARVRCHRRDELAALAVRKYLDALCVYFWAATSLLFSLATFGLYAVLGRPLTSQVVFTSLALFNVLLAPINAFPWVINGVVEAIVSVRRVTEFLCMPETAGHCSLQPPGPKPAGGGASPAICISGSFTWGGASTDGVAAVAGQAEPDASAAGRQLEGASGAAVLRGIELRVPAGSLVAVTGRVGCGKSSLLSAVLGEMMPAASRADDQQQRDKSTAVGEGMPLGGCVAAGSTVAYVPQEPWIMHGTLRDNVLLGRKYEAGRYAAVLWASALAPDLAAMPAGDLTMAGGAGATLSGGQRARLALARALYQNADVLLLDDCLAAVDARVAAWVLRHALLGPLLWAGEPSDTSEQTPGLELDRDAGPGQQEHRLRPCTVVVATHASALLEAADVVVEMSGGAVAAVREQPGGAARRRQLAAEAAEDDGSAGALVSDSGKQQQQQHGPPGGQAQQAERQTEEERDQGHVRWAVYRSYAAATGWGWVALILASLALMQATRNGNDLWLSHWVSATATQPNATLHGSVGGGPPPRLHFWCAAAAPAPGGVPPPTCLPQAAAGSLDPQVRFYLSVLLAIAAANSVFTLARAFSFAKGGLVAAQRVHERLLGAVLALPLAFFDATPPGRVLNRCSSDTATVDDSLPFILNILLANLASLAGVAAVLCLTQPAVLCLLPPLGALYRSLQRYYRATSRELRRLDAVARSPVYTAFSEVVSGGATIRAFGAQPHFLRAAERAVAAQQRASVSSAAAGSWLGLRLQLMAGALAAAVAGAAVAEHAGSLPWAQHSGPASGSGRPGARASMAAGLVGLSLSYVLPITGLLSGLLTSSAETEQEMVAAERVFQYLRLGDCGANGGGSAQRPRKPSAPAARCEPDLEALQPLLPPAATAGRPPSPGGGAAGWLSRGHVCFEDVWLRYEPWRPPGLAAGSPADCGASSGAGGASRASDGGAAVGGDGGPWVLRGVTLDIQPGSHVGICGRTGAGKSSLLAALLRLAPLARGRVRIDGRDVAGMPVATLRAAVGVVPQHPFLFEGSVAENLDPQGCHTPAELAAALRQVELWQPLAAQLQGLRPGSTGVQSGGGQPGGGEAVGVADGAASEREVLALRLGEGGAALSAGQQQLLALARVLLRRPRLLLLDEATAFVDPATAGTMHEVIRQHLAGSTILEVAHRESTIASCGRVVVMEAGQVVEVL